MLPRFSRSSFSHNSFLLAEERAARASLEKEEALIRLREVEARLREAIEDLHRNHGKQDWYSSLFSSRHPLCEHVDSCVANAIGSLCHSFLLAYGVRVGIGVLLRAFKLAKNRPYQSILDLKLLVSENNFIVREEACRIGLLFGGFSGCYHAIRCTLRRLRDKETPVNGLAAGAIAGLSVLALDDHNKRRTFALYLLARVAQCAYNSAKSKNKFHFWGSHWQHGDTLLFALACSQVMYGYVMRPETLPEAYLDFIVKTGPIPKPVLKAVRESCRGGPIDITALSAFLTKIGSSAVELHPSSPILPCSVVHPTTPSCLAQNSRAMRSTFRKTFPLYMSLTFVPFVILNIQKFMEAPVHTFWNAFKGAVRSTTFISVFVGIYQGIICLQRKVMAKDHKAVYWFSGAGAALSILLEKKSRRAELALYVLPRAADSLWYILVNRHLLPNVKYAEVFLFCLCMGGLMHYYEHEPGTMAPFLRGLMKKFLNRNGTSDHHSLQRTSYSYLKHSIPKEKSPIHLEDTSILENQVENNSASSVQVAEKLNAEAFQGL